MTTNSFIWMIQTEETLRLDSKTCPHTMLEFRFFCAKTRRQLVECKSASLWRSTRDLKKIVSQFERWCVLEIALWRIFLKCQFLIFLQQQKNGRHLRFLWQRSKRNHLIWPRSQILLLVCLLSRFGGFLLFACINISRVTSTLLSVQDHGKGWSLQTPRFLLQ